MHKVNKTNNTDKALEHMAQSIFIGTCQQSMKNFLYNQFFTTVTYASGTLEKFKISSLSGESIPNIQDITDISIAQNVKTIEKDTFKDATSLSNIVFNFKTEIDIQATKDQSGNFRYPWGISNTSIIHPGCIDNRYSDENAIVENMLHGQLQTVI